MFVIFILFSLTGIMASFADCHSPFQTEGPVILRSDSPFDQSPESLQRTFQNLLSSKKRYEYRGFVKDSTYLLPKMAGNVTGQTTVEGHVEVPPHFVGALQTHLTQSLKMGYAKQIMYGDLGHGHLMLPESFYSKEYDDLDDVKLTELMLSHPETHILYHAAEQLRIGSDPETLHRLEKRNIIGSIKRPGDIQVIKGQGSQHTAAYPKGMIGMMSIYFSASREGCLPMKDFGIDLSLHGPSN